MDRIKELEKEFKRKGSHFLQLHASGKMYVYQVTTKEKHVFYEVFERRINTRFGCISYPGDESFGIWAKCVNTLERAMHFFNNGIKSKQ